MSEMKSAGFEHFKRQVSPGGAGAAAAALSAEGVTLHIPGIWGIRAR